MRSLGRGRLFRLVRLVLIRAMEIGEMLPITHRQLVAVQHRGPIDPCPCQTVGLVARRGSQSQ